MMKDLSDKERESYLEEYKILVSILLQDEVLFWRRSEVFIIINGGLLTVLGLLHPKDVLSTPTVNSIPVVISAVGVLLCILWLFIIIRSEAFYNHWYEHLIFLEEKYLDPLDIYTVANDYFNKKEIKLIGKPQKLAFIPGLMRMAQALQIAAGVFAVIWIVMGIYVIIT